MDALAAQKNASESRFRPSGGALSTDRQAIEGYGAVPHGDLLRVTRKSKHSSGVGGAVAEQGVGTQLDSVAEKPEGRCCVARVLKTTGGKVLAKVMHGDAQCIA